MNERILVVRFGALGDVILTSPAVLNLRLAFPEHHITYLTKERYRPIVERFDGLDEVLTIPDDIAAMPYLAFVAGLRRSDWSAVIDLHGKPRSWLVRRLTGTRQGLVYPKRRRERMAVTRRNKTLPSTWPHTIDLYNRAVVAFGGEAVAERPLLMSSDRSVSTYARTVVIAPGAAHPPKRFPFERFTAIAKELIESQGAHIVWAVTQTDYQAWPIEQHLPDADLTVEIDRSLTDLAGIIQRAALTVANDSGIAHLSSSVGTPVLALFGPTHPVLGFAPQGLHDRVIEVAEACRPCSRHGRTECWRESRFCFDRIDSRSIVEEATRLLDVRAKSAPALLVDRDGTLIVDKHYLSDPDRIEFTPGSVEALKGAKDQGFKIVVLSNQSGVARGYFDEATVHRVNGRLIEMCKERGLAIDGLYYCPHYEKGEVPEYAIRCACRKPRPGLAERAAIELNLDLRRSWVIGDKRDDLSLARVLGGRGVLVRTGHGEEAAKKLSSRETAQSPIAEDLAAAVNLILQEDSP